METYDFKSVGYNSHGHELLAVVAAVHHQGVGETLDDGALGFAETLYSVAAGGVGDVDWGANLDVIAGGRRWESAKIVRLCRDVV